MNILLIESDDFTRSLFRTLLERHRFRVAAVKDYDEGLAAAGRSPFDLVVAQFFDEDDVAHCAELLAVVGRQAPWFKLLAVVSGFRTYEPTAMAIRHKLNAWRTVDLTWGGQVVIDACRDAANERRAEKAPDPAHQGHP